MLSTARVYYHCALGFAGQFTTVLPSLQAYLYCIRAKTFTNEHEIRRNDKGTKGTMKRLLRAPSTGSIERLLV